MQVKSILKAVNGLDGVEVKSHNDYGSRMRYHIEGAEYYCTFWDDGQDGQASCVHLCRNGDKSDSMIDYFPGFYPDRLKTVVEYLCKK